MIEQISIFDLFLVALVLIFGIKGLISGIIKETFGLVGIVGGIFLASRFAEKMGNLIDANVFHISNKSSIYFIGFLSTLILFWLLSVFVGMIFTKLINLSGLGFINKVLGFLVGSLKVLLLFSIIVFALRSVDMFKGALDKKLSGSYSYPYLIKTGRYIVNFNVEAATDVAKEVNNKIVETSEKIINK